MLYIYTGVILSNLYKDYSKPLYKPETQNDLFFFDGQPPSKRGNKNSNQKTGPHLGSR